MELVDVTDVHGGVQVTNKVTVEIEGSERPALVAEWLTRQHL
jgi:acyl dehydratase